MINNKEVVAIIPAKDDSKRIKRKNFRELSGKSLLGRKITQLKNSKYIDRVVVGSKSLEVLEEAKRYGAETVTEEEYIQTQSSNKMIHNLVSRVETDIVVWAHCTNPFIETKTYDNAIELFSSNLETCEYDSLVSVYKVQEHLWGTDKKPMNYNPYAETHPLAKELPVLYAQDGGIFIQPHKQMLENSYFFGKKPYLFEMSANEILDINVEKELKIAEILVELYEK
ncbi:MAG: acylneuraminate cytidylyltransferase family protein [Proteobacteria bacterium]|nr:acylneuraminate cytidylyltransferase family protein [Pseudomonadota bacterium]